jgi:hypothetical protein
MLCSTGRRKSETFAGEPKVWRARKSAVSGTGNDEWRGDSLVPARPVRNRNHWELFLMDRRAKRKSDEGKVKG